MLVPTSISLQPALGTNQDFNFLKAKGLEYIESLASQVWTDYNVHDPGITILDLLCYAITDLAARTRLPMRDLIAESPGHSFLTARDVLPNQALTLKDYRKLLIDRPESRDARILPATDAEARLYYDAAAATLTYTKTPAPLQLKGLLNTQLELPGKWNEDWIEERINLDSGQFTPIHFYFDQYTDAHPVWFSHADISSVTFVDASEPAGAEDKANPGFYDRYYFRLDITFSDGTLLDDKQFWARIKTAIPKADAAADQAVKAFIRNTITTLDGQNPLIRYQERLVQLRQQLNALGMVLNGNRNLGEVWYQVRGFGIQTVGIRIEELEIIPEADKEEVVGRVYLAVDQYLTPFIKHRSLEELLREGYLPEKIYEGPLLENGFLTDEALAPLERNDNIYTSDVVARIMNLEIGGVKPVIGVKGLEFISHINAFEVARQVKNCLRPRDLTHYKLRFSTFHSRVKVRQEGVAAGADWPEMGVARYLALKADLERFVPPGTADIPVVVGKKRSVGNYYSIQHDFPAKYKLTAGAITEQDSPKRAAQAKQLKAYLLFFEQLLADYCAQLANLEQLFSSDPAIARTYFFQPPLMVPGVESLINLPDYQHHLEQITESSATFLQRRNQMIDHLLARFAEQFSEYAAKVYQTNSNWQLAKDKLDFLNNYPSLSSNRALAFDYCRKKADGSTDVWDTDNVSGFEKRVAALLGMPRARRRALSVVKSLEEHVEIYDEKDVDGIREARFRIRLKPIAEDPRSKIVLSSSTRYTVDQDLQDELRKVYLFGPDRANYTIFSAVDGTFYFNLLDDTGETIARRIEPFDTTAEAEAAIRTLIELFQVKADEGFHLIEHILLRPRDPGYKLLPIPTFALGPANPAARYIEDPYTAQVTIILPAYAGRFNNAGFRALVEKVMRMELPAHLFPYFIWVQDENQLKAFEAAYQPWLEALCSGINLSQLTADLIDQLTLLKK